MEPTESVRFKVEVSKRHWQRYETFRVQFSRAAAALAEAQGDPELAMADISRRQFERWLSGDVRTLPRPNQCRILEHLLGIPVAALFKAAPVATVGSDDAHPQRSTRDLLFAASEAASAFLETEGSTFGSMAAEDLDEDLTVLCRRSLTAPAELAIGDYVAVQRRALEACRAERRPGPLRDRYVSAAIASALVAKASQDMGYLHTARKHVRLAMHCAGAAEHTRLQAWLYGLSSLIAYWSGDYELAASDAESGVHVIRLGDGTASSWLPALGARANAMLGNAESVAGLVGRAEAARNALVENEMDKLGGLMVFNNAKQDYYTAEALVLLGTRDDEGLVRASQAIAGYELSGPETRSFSDEAGARATIALAHAKKGDAVAASESLRPVMTLDPSRRIQGIMTSVGRVQMALDRSSFAKSRAALDLADELRTFREESRMATDGVSE